MALPKTRPTARQAETRRGRPFKFGRPTRVVVLSLPEDVVDWLRAMHDDLARAIVALFERRQPALRGKSGPRRALGAELVPLPGRRGLIVVESQHLQKLQGVSIIPLSHGRAFLALEPLKGLADLELAVLDRLDDRGLASRRREALQAFCNQLRRWRRTPGLRFTTRSIILAEGVGRERRVPPRRARR